MIDRHLRVTLVGEGERAERWAVALRNLAEVCPLPERLHQTIDALVLAPGARDPCALAKEALHAGIPVLYAAPFLLSPWQTTTLNELSRHGGSLLRFAEPFQHRPGFAFLRRLLGGEEPLWRPLYLRALRLARPQGPVRIDELVAEDLAMCEVLLDGTPQSVTAAASRRDEAGEVCAAFLTIHYADGCLVQCTVSLAEAVSAGQLVVTTPHRTIMLDELDPAAPLRIMGHGGHEFPTEEPALVPSWQIRTDSLSLSSDLDPIGEEAKGFLNAVAAKDRAAANGDRWERVAALWWAARQSMSFGAPTQVPGPTRESGYAKPPPLRVIQGGGRTAPTAWKRPPLTVVAR